ncbi:MAG: hypothetical protein JO357_12150 [Hyphomicrobiales bacterium]|nr:hypothetical protein [Hyphomicrobiales bacterium]MBV8769302.1 hypothetical protein [Hyphomicrobiales bacterium]MBV9052849.1 hypothetical protein [Hyphomicrobiales bacterium]MBV9137799.1 hypothetical protein [Hyphomicrobiales bacterium]MBV9591994.1 hypothetical protein [Hyphomicrobiales bacterium]
MMTRSPKLLRDHAEALSRLAKRASAEDRACLLAAAHERLRIADKIDQAHRLLHERAERSA